MNDTHNNNDYLWFSDGRSFPEAKKDVEKEIPSFSYSAIYGLYVYDGFRDVCMCNCNRNSEKFLFNLDSGTYWRGSYLSLDDSVIQIT